MHIGSTPSGTPGPATAAPPSGTPGPGTAAPPSGRQTSSVGAVTALTEALGHPHDARLLIISCANLGQAHGANEAIFESLEVRAPKQGALDWNMAHQVVSSKL